MIKIILLVLLAQTLASTGQVFFKKASNALEAPHLKSLGSYAVFLGRILGKTEIWAGLLIMGLGLVVWLGAISQGDLSLVYPLGSVYYIIVLIFAHHHLDEKMHKAKLLGTLLIVLGIALISVSRG